MLVTDKVNRNSREFLLLTIYASQVIKIYTLFLVYATLGLSFTFTGNCLYYFLPYLTTDFMWQRSGLNNGFRNRSLVYKLDYTNNVYIVYIKIIDTGDENNLVSP